MAKALKRSADTAMLQMQNGRFGNEELTKIQENALELIAALNENQTDAVEDALIGTPRYVRYHHHVTITRSVDQELPKCQ